ncbi:FAD-dependent oxidoreductase [Geminicoccaceae bacterium 1502E]|nr:FAD-dependent oxidoreductase [Geminicoccaceae bacterium 1502E]
MRIAIVGAGISGLGAARLLHRRHQVTIFEAEPRAGGHSHTVTVTANNRQVPVDTGFIVYNEINYPSLTRLFRELDVPTRESDMSLAVSVGDGAFEYAGSSAGALFGQRRNLVRPRFLRMLLDIPRFNRDARRFLASGRDDGRTIGHFVQPYGRLFREGYLVPMAAAIWSAPCSTILDFPARRFLTFFDNHGLLSVAGQHRWRTVSGGSRAYVERLVTPMAGSLRLATPVRAVRRTGAGVEIVTQGGAHVSFDQVLLATHADQSLRLLSNATPSERAILGAISYRPNRVVLHSDPSLMPRRRRLWSSWNYMARSRALGTEAVSVTYWMNRLQSIDPDIPLFVSVNPLREPDPALVHRELSYAHPMLDEAAVAAQTRVGSIQGAGGVWLAGAWLGNGFHEDGLASGIAAAEAIEAAAVTTGAGGGLPDRAAALPA